MTGHPHLLAVIVAAAAAASAAPAAAQSRALVPGSYGPVFQEPGFHEKGGYFNAGFQATVNHYGGNLIVSATDASVPSQGGFRLSFSRTHNSNRTLSLTQTILNQGDSPLGMAWTAHYGLLWTAAPGQDPTRPELIDGTGARHIFHRHNQLNAAIPIGSATTAWISSELEILTRTDSDHWVLRTPAGLVYDLTKLPQYAFLVPTRITDAHGNIWDIVYDATVGPYFEHPLPSTVTDGFGRTLRFDYFVPAAMNGKKRLRFLRLGGANGTVLAEYQYTHTADHNFGFLKKHLTGEGRVTEYWTDTDAIPEFGTITQIRQPTGGDTVFGYAVRTFFFTPGTPTITYAVTSTTHGGHSWTYQYPGSAQPANGEFTVTVSADNNVVGSYTYFTYSTPTPCDANVWKVGTLLRSTESYAGTTRSRTLTPTAFTYSQSPNLANCAQLPQIPRLTVDSVVTDGTTLTTSYGQHDALNFARHVDQPGGVARDVTFQHVATAARYQLGAMLTEEVRAGNVLISRSGWRYPSSTAVLPDRLWLYRDDSNSVDVDLTYYVASAGKGGALRTKSYGRSSTTYDYQNGVVSSADFAEGPDLARTINANGTIASETKDGVTRSYSWDRDFRPTLIDNPNALTDVEIAYTNTVATVTQGVREQRLTYDAFGRLSERRTHIQRSPTVHATETFASFDAFDRATEETTPSGATYTAAYDVEGRLTSRSAAGDAHVYGYTTTASTVTTTHTANGSVVRRSATDHLGRPTRGELNSRPITTAYTSDSGAPAGLRATYSPDGQQEHWMRHDLLGTLVAEHHPETGTTTARVSAEGWIEGLNKPVNNFNYTLDRLGRPSAHFNSGAGVPFLTRTWDPVYGQPLATDVAQFGKRTRTEYLDPDTLGRPTVLRVTIPRAFDAPVPTYPWPSWQRGGIPTPTQAGYDPNFRWTPVSGAGSYDLELVQAPRELSQHDCMVGTVLARVLVPAGATSLPFPVALANKTPYCFRVRARAGGLAREIGPFSYWVMFTLGGAPRWPNLPTTYIKDDRLRQRRIACASQYTLFGGGMVECPKEETPRSASPRSRRRRSSRRRPPTPSSTSSSTTTPSAGSMPSSTPTWTPPGTRTPGAAAGRSTRSTPRAATTPSATAALATPSARPSSPARPTARPACPCRSPCRSAIPRGSSPSIAPSTTSGA